MSKTNNDPIIFGTEILEIQYAEEKIWTGSIGATKN
jgi:hypothetical protein